MHGRWMHWAQNPIEHRRTQGHKNMFMSRNTETDNLSNSDLQRIVNRDGDKLQEIVKNMQIYNANIVGSNAYFYKYRRNLESLIEFHGCPNSWYNMSAADNYWHDLHTFLNSFAKIGYDKMDKK